MKEFEKLEQLTREALIDFELNEPTHKLNLYVVVDCLLSRGKQLESKIEDIKNGDYICATEDKIILINDAISRKSELKTILKLILSKSNEL